MSFEQFKNRYAKREGREFGKAKYMRIRWSNGGRDEASNLNEAKAIIKRKYPSAFFWDEGERTLAWRNEAESENDDGAKAVAEILG